MLIAHFSDPHIRPHDTLQNGTVDINAMFPPLLQQLNAMTPRPDVVLMTGDLVNSGSAAEYAVAVELLRGLDLPLLLLPGNHDERERLRACFPGSPAAGPLHFVVEGPVRIVGVDVTVPGHDHGDFDPAAEAWLEAALAAGAGRPTMVAMHQPPFVTHIAFMDQSLCRRGERLAALLARHPEVVRLVCGHVHRGMVTTFGGTVLCTAPSTSTAIALRLDPDAQPATYLEPPGFLLHHWDGARMTTHAVPVGTFPGLWGFT